MTAIRFRRTYVSWYVVPFQSFRSHTFDYLSPVIWSILILFLIIFFSTIVSRFYFYFTFLLVFYLYFTSLLIFCFFPYILPLYLYFIIRFLFHYPLLFIFSLFLSFSSLFLTFLFSNQNGNNNTAFSYLLRHGRRFIFIHLYSPEFFHDSTTKISLPLPFYSYVPRFLSLPR